jgi:hypothetical protein
LLRGCPIILLPILWWSTSIGVDVVHMLRVAALAFIVARSWGFVWFNHGLAELSELFIELWHCFGSLSD